MGIKKPVFSKPILLALQDGPLAGKELIKKAYDSIDDENPKKPKSDPRGPFAEALLYLLNDEIIQIDGYDMSLDISRKRKQSLNPDGFIFSLVKTDPIELLQLIMDLEDNDKKVVYKSYNDLRKRFIKRVLEIESKTLAQWEEMKENIIIRECRAEDLLELEGLTKEFAMMYAFPEFINLTCSNPQRIKESKYYEKEISKIRDKYKDYRVFIWKDPENKNLYGYAREILSTTVSKDENGNDITLIEINPEYNDMDYDKFISGDPTFNKTEYLENLGFDEPIKSEVEEINTLFKIIFYKYSKSLASELAIGLSELPDSDITLNRLVSKYTGKKLIIERIPPSLPF